MGQHAKDALQNILDEEDYRARELPDDEPINPLFEYDIPTVENIDNELAKLMNYLN